MNSNNDTDDLEQEHLQSPVSVKRFVVTRTSKMQATTMETRPPIPRLLSCSSLLTDMSDWTRIVRSCFEFHHVFTSHSRVFCSGAILSIHKLLVKPSASFTESHYGI